MPGTSPFQQICSLQRPVPRPALTIGACGHLLKLRAMYATDAWVEVPIENLVHCHPSLRGQSSIPGLNISEMEAENEPRPGS